MDHCGQGGGRRVVLTGAAGRIGRAIRPLLPDEWELVLTDLTAAEGIAALDVTDLDACRAAFAGADSVVHLAAVPDPDATWAQLLPANVVGAYHVTQAAAEQRVRRLVLASSLHAMSGAPDATQFRADDQPRPGNAYGVTKAFAEALGAWIAATTETSAVALRIGYFNEQRPDVQTGPPHEVAAWLSPRDAAELVRSAVEAELPGFTVANGVSANRYRVADLEVTRQRLGYRPVDDAWAAQ